MKNSIHQIVQILRGKRILCIVILTVVYFLFFMNFIKTGNTVYFGADDWDYQSMAVNFSLGNHFHKTGGMYDLSFYKFDRHDPAKEMYWKSKAGLINFYRTPVYPLFIGCIYKIAGVNPLTVKYVQLLLLSLLASCLPWLGYYCWGVKGFLTGILSSIIFLCTSYKFSDRLMIESLAITILFVIVCLFLYMDKTKTRLSEVLFGISIGLAVLIKGIFVFIPVVLILYYVIHLLYYKKDYCNFSVPLIIISFLLTILPWCLYASITSGSFIFISTQGFTSLLDGNNEFCLDGGWHHEWAYVENSFYNLPDIAQLSLVRKVVSFYHEHPSLLPKIIGAKLYAGFSPMFFLFLFLNAHWQRTLAILIARYKKLLIFTYIFSSLYLGMFSLVFWYTHFSQHDFSGSLLLWIQFISLILFTISWFIIHKNKMEVPLIFIIVFLNFILFTIIYYVHNEVYPSRFVKTMDFLFILLAIQVFVEYIALGINILKHGHDHNA